MKKRGFSAILILTIVFTNILGFSQIVQGSDVAESEIISGTDFSDGINMRHYGSYSEFSVEELEGDSVLSLSAGDSVFMIGYVQNQELEIGRYCFSLDMFLEDYSALKYFKVFGDDASDLPAFGSESSYTIYSFLRDGTSMARRANTYITDRTLKKGYKTGEWINIKVWIDTKNREFIFYIGDEKTKTIPFDENLNQVKGIAFVKEGTLSGNIYLDNIEFSKENEAYCDGFDPLYISAETNDGIIGNNFYNNLMPEFNVTFKNRLKKDQKAVYSFLVEDSDKNVIYKSREQEINVLQGESVEEKISINEKHYGVMTLKITVESEGKTFTKEVPYTLSNCNAYNPESEDNAPRNKKSGMNAHFYNNTGDYKKALPLMANAGVGALRDLAPAWGDIEKEKGIYDFSKKEEFLNTVADYGIDYMLVFTTANKLWNNMSGEGDEWAWLPPSDDEGRAALGRYMTELTKWANGRIKWIEVWNEWYNYSMSGCFFQDDGTVYAPLHKAVYDGVHNEKTKDYPNIEVVGICGDLPSISWMDKYLSKMTDGKYFDAISLHPYAKGENLNPEYPIFKNTVDATAELLEKYEMDSDIPYYFTETGWSEDSLGYDKELQAAYTIRNLAMSEASGYGDVVFNYNFLEETEKYGSSPHEGTFGVVESYSPGGTEVPYLGKPAYVALAYYNSLMADATFSGNLDLGASDTFGYKFKTRTGDEVLMLGTTDDSEKSINLKNISGFTISDMYGNERKEYSENSVINIDISSEPVYIIGTSMDNVYVTDEEMKSDGLLAVINGELTCGISKERVYVRVYDSLGNIFYTDSCMSDKNGEFNFSVPVTGIKTGEVLKAELTVNDSVFSEYDIYVVNNDAAVKAAVCVGRNNADITRKFLIEDVVKSGNAGEFVCLDVLNGGYSAKSLSEENFFDAVYYRDQTVTDSQGRFSFELTVDLAYGEEKEIYIKTGSGEEKTYLLENSGTKDDITVTVLDNSKTKISPYILLCGRENERLEFVSGLELTSNEGKYMVYNTKAELGEFDVADIICLEDIKTARPIGFKAEIKK